jgi:hypothetical protein
MNARRHTCLPVSGSREETKGRGGQKEAKILFVLFVLLALSVPALQPLYLLQSQRGCD